MTRRVIEINKANPCGACGEKASQWVVVLRKSLNSQHVIEGGELWYDYEKVGKSIHLCSVCYEEFAPYTLIAEKNPMIVFKEEG